MINLGVLLLANSQGSKTELQKQNNILIPNVLKVCNRMVPFSYARSHRHLWTALILERTFRTWEKIERLKCKKLWLA